MIKFKRLKVKDVIETYQEDADVAKAISRNLVGWDFLDPHTEEEVPLPEPDTDAWYLEIGWVDWLDLVNKWAEWRSQGLPKQTSTE